MRNLFPSCKLTSAEEIVQPFERICRDNVDSCGTSCDRSESHGDPHETGGLAVAGGWTVPVAS